MSTLTTILVIAGLTAITVGTRCFFLVTERELPLPGWLRRGLRYAPLAALAAVVVPEVVMTQDQLLHTWRDARLYAVAASTAWFFWRRTLLGTIVSGMVVMVPLKVLLGW